jgi:type I restriction enzyme S subunit
MSWRELSLKDICHVDWGNTKLTKSSYVNNGKFLAVSAAGADGLINHYEHEANVPVLSAIGAQCGRMFYPGERFTAIKNTITLTPKEELADGKFLYYLFTHVELPQRGAGQPFISKGDIEAFRVSIPESLEEQREIVAKLDSAFADLNTLERNLVLKNEKSNELLQSLLSASFAGSGSGLEAGNSLVNQEIAKNIMSLGEICEISTGSTDTKDAVENGKYPLFDRSKKVKASDKFLFDCEALIIPGEGAEFLPRHYIGKFDLHQRAYALFNFSNVVDPQFLYYFLISAKDYFADNAVGATVKSLRRRHFTDLQIPLPTIETQREIVEKLDSVFTEIELLKTQFNSQKDFSGVLRQSLLSSVFNVLKAVA